MVVRWTIGSVQPAGFISLRISVTNFQYLYPECERYICCNGLDETQIDQLKDLPAKIIRQENEPFIGEPPKGAAWKLRPSRICISDHELFIDNDLILTDRLTEIDKWLDHNNTLLLEGQSRHYGSFDRHIPKQYNINSGLFGIPPGFDLSRYLALWGRWDNNCPNQSVTWNEQGFVASILTHYAKPTIVPATVITNCETELVKAPGMHFVSLNRIKFHRPFAEYRFSLTRNLL